MAVLGWGIFAANSPARFCCKIFPQGGIAPRYLCLQLRRAAGRRLFVRSPGCRPRSANTVRRSSSCCLLTVLCVLWWPAQSTALTGEGGRGLYVCIPQKRRHGLSFCCSTVLRSGVPCDLRGRSAIKAGAGLLKGRVPALQCQCCWTLAGSSTGCRIVCFHAQR